MDRIPFAAMACAVFAIVAIGGCQRPLEHVSTSTPENLSRNTSATTPAPQPAPSDPTPPLRAAPAARAAISDAVIAAKIGAELMADDAMKGADVSVQAEHGVVVLAGTVKSYEQVGIASAYAQREDGVMRVDNQLSLAPQ